MYNALIIEETVDGWPDGERHAFWDQVAIKVAEERMDPDAAICEVYQGAAFEEMFGGAA